MKGGFQKSLYRGEETEVTVREQGLCALLVVRTLSACVKLETDYHLHLIPY